MYDLVILDSRDTANQSPETYLQVPSVVLLLLLSLATLVSTAKVPSCSCCCSKAGKVKYVLQVKRNPFDGGSGFPSFFAAAKAPFGDSSSSSYNAPAPASAPSYSAPAPSYSAPAPAPTPSYSAPEPSYSAPAPSYSTPSYHQPTHNCSIQEETLEAQVSREP